MATRIYGIDVSHHQGTIDWVTVSSELRRVNSGKNPGFAILRIGYSRRDGKGGLITDGQILRNLNGCSQNGIPIGIYNYCYDITPEAAAITMEQVCQMIKGYKIEYPVVYDIEYGTNDGKAYKSESNYCYSLASNKINNTGMVISAMKEVEKAGYYGMVYASRNFFTSYTNLDDLNAYDKWEAAYTSTDTSTVQNGIWQFSSSNPLQIKGFGNKLDCDVAYKDYASIINAAGLNGTKEHEPVKTNVLKYLVTQEMSYGDQCVIDALINGEMTKRKLEYSWKEKASGDQ